MGYKATKKIFDLRFADPEMAGLEVKAKNTSAGDFLAIQRRALAMQQTTELTEQDLDTIDDLFGRFANVLLAWNLEDEGPDGEDEPVAPTKAGLLSQDFDFVMVIINAWLEAVGGVDEDLGKDSASGGSFPEVNIPMELLSSNPSS